MPIIITEKKLEKIEYAIDKFLKALKDRESIIRDNLRLSEESFRILFPEIKKWMNFLITEINNAFDKKYIRKDAIEFKKDKAIDITTQVLDWEKLNEQGVQMLKPATLEIMAGSANQANKIAGIEASFDIINPEAVKSVNRLCSELVTGVTKETKQAINHVIREGIKEGKSMGKVAKELKSVVGLNDRQVKALDKYKNWLEVKRPDLSILQRQKLIDRYNNKLHNYRTEMIARTESMRAVNEGQVLSYKEAGYKTVIWSANVNCCPECDAENGHEYTIEESIGMLPAHTLCRCTWLPGSKEMPEEYPTRDHLPSIMREKESVDQFMEDAELKGKIFTRGEATEIYDNVREFTSIDFYKEVRIYQTSGVEGLKIRNIEPWRIKRAQEIAQSLEEYSKYSMKYSRVNIYRGIDLTSKEVAAFKKGQIIDMMGTSSWSSDPLVSARFGNAQFIMKNKTGVSVKHISYTHGENEVIIAKAAKFKIIKITEGPKGIFDIYIEEIITKVPKMPKVLS